MIIQTFCRWIEDCSTFLQKQTGSVECLRRSGPDLTAVSIEMGWICQEFEQECAVLVKLPTEQEKPEWTELCFIEELEEWGETVLFLFFS